MKTALIVSEYNPFHKGHEYQIKKLKEEYGITHVISLMSGNFTQRGLPSLFDRFIRAEAAVKGGCDLVIELPAVFAVSSAEFFASGAVNSAYLLSSVDYISFGCENPDREAIINTATILNEEDGRLKTLIQDNLKKGMNYPLARSESLKILTSGKSAGIVDSPNNILAVEYVRALLKLQDPPDFIPIARKGAGYHDTVNEPRSFASATGIRKNLSLLDENEEIRWDARNLIGEDIPPESLEVFLCNIEKRTGVSANEKLAEIIFTRLTMEPECIFKIQESGDGLGERILKNLELLKTHDYEEAVRKLNTRRFTNSRIKRLLLHTALHYDLTDYAGDRKRTPESLRILAMNSRGMEYLGKTRKTREIDLRDTSKGNSDSLSSYDRRASSLYSLINPHYSSSWDYTKNPVIIRE